MIPITIQIESKYTKSSKKLSNPLLLLRSHPFFDHPPSSTTPFFDQPPSATTPPSSSTPFFDLPSPFFDHPPPPPPPPHTHTLLRSPHLTYSILLHRAYSLIPPSTSINQSPLRLIQFSIFDISDT